MLFLTILLVSSCSAQFMDELQSFDAECMREDRFPCYGAGAGQCVMLSQFCDGIIDCADGTDENFCSDHLPDEQLCNETHQYLCEDKTKCIPHHWICNGERDCDDGTDERNCSSILVQKNSKCGGFTCGDGKCISNLWVCDGVYDCEDMTDEDYVDFCRHATLTHEYLDTSNCPRTGLRESSYKCTDNSFCLPADLMCDGLSDCRDGSDEGTFCANWTTMCKNFTCHGNNTQCYPDRTGPRCACLSPGNLQYNPETQRCEDIDECTLDRPHCSHSCNNFHGHFQCECDHGYKKDKLEYLCYAKGPEAMLFFSTRNDIKLLKIQSKQLVTVVSGVKEAHGVSYDGKYLYWVETAEGHESIMRAHLEDIEDTKEVLVGLGLEEPGDIAIDWIGGNLFFSDVDRGAIFACKLDGSACTTLGAKTKHPRYITVDPNLGTMYWSDFIDHAVIMTSQMDGSNSEVLVDKLTSFATGLALDAPNDRLYFVDRTIKVVLLAKKRVYSLFEEPFHHPYSISVFENTVFWSDWTSNTIQTTDKMHDTKENRHVLLTLDTAIYGMHMYHPAMTQTKYNPCLNHNCSHICVPLATPTYRCLCPADMKLRGNVCHHKRTYHPKYLVVGGGQIFTRIEYDTLGSPETHATYFDIGRVQAMAYDSFRDALYIYDGQRRNISYVNMTDFTFGLIHELISQGLDNVVDMDYDHVTDSLYFLDAGRGLIEVISLRNRRRAIVYQFRDLEVPISFCLLPDYGKLMVVVVESDNSIRIDCMGLDGDNRHRILMKHLKGPHVRLRYAQSMDRVFVTDEGNGVIDTIHPEGTGRENFRELSTTITSVALTDTYVFWTDRRTPRLFWSHLHEATHRIRRIHLSIFPNATQLLIQSTSPSPRSYPSHPCLSTPCSDICVQSSPPNIHTRTYTGYKCLCPPGLVMKNGICTKVVTCTVNEYYCHRSNACLDKGKRCDGVMDCVYGEDEVGCIVAMNTTTPCSDTEFRCGDSDICIGRSLVCDGRADCPDGYDESEAECLAITCFDTEFMCASGSCILKYWKCDGDYDCNDASDEVGCENMNCKAGYFQCRNRDCIEMKKRCDGTMDCSDYSDEEDCDEPVIFDIEEEKQPCADVGFACELNKTICLPLTARCNKKIDCPGGTDEDGCDFRCAPHGRFACKQQLRCLAYNQVCDHHMDCDDGSDEMPDACALVTACVNNSCPYSCQATPQGPHCNCGAGWTWGQAGCEDVDELDKTSYLYPPVVPESECNSGFLCTNSSQCIEWKQLCDNTSDCFDGSDEGVMCLTACVNNSCPYSCQATPQGPHCNCGAGWTWGQAGCEDVDECKLEPCAHTCHNVPGTFTCSCHLGYAMRSDGRSCKAVRGNMAIVYVSGNNVRAVSADGFAITEYGDIQLPNITDIDLHVRNNILYITSAESRKLIQVNGTNVVSISNIGRPTRVSVDWVSGNVYFVDSNNGSSCIRVCHVRRKRCAVLQKLPANAEVTSLILDPKSALMFYCVTHDLESVVWSATLSGHEAKDLATVRNCTGLAVDSFNKKLYVAETEPPKISRMDYNGGELTNFLQHSHLQSPHTLAIFEDYIYYLVSNSLRLGRCRLFATKHCETFIHRVFDANTFVIRHESVQRDDVVDECDAVACEGVCVRTEGGPVCLCDDGGVAKGGVCPLVNKSNLPLFNGWTYQEYLRAHHASFTVIGAVFVSLAVYIALFVYYHFVYKPRKKTYTEVRYHTNRGGEEALSYAATVDFVSDGNVSHEFVNPLQYVRNLLRHSVRKNKPIGTANLTFESVDISSSSAQQDLSDTESDLDDKERLISRRK